MANAGSHRAPQLVGPIDGSRRTVLKAGLALPVAMGLWGNAFAGTCRSADEALSCANIDLAVVDRRIAASVSFMEEARKYGVSVNEIHGDVTNLWMRLLEQRGPLRSMTLI